MTTLAEEARKVAVSAHGDQTYGTQPYIEHLQQTVEILKSVNLYDEKWQAAGYLHDVLEDTLYTYPELVVNFGPDVALKVLAVSKPPKHLTKTRKEANLIMYEQIKLVPEAAVLKLADRLANVLNGEKNDMYDREHDLFVQEMKRAIKNISDEHLRVVAIDLIKRIENWLYNWLVDQD